MAKKTGGRIAASIKGREIALRTSWILKGPTRIQVVAIFFLFKPLAQDADEALEPRGREQASRP